MSEPANTPLDEIQENKLYSPKHIGVATFLGGPLVSAYLMAHNFKVLEKPHLIRKTWKYAIFALGIPLLFIFLLPEEISDKIPNITFPAIYVLIVSQVTKKHQETEVNACMESGGSVFSWWRVLGISVLGAIITLAILLTVLFFISAILTTYIL